jgi:hypothetical protein
MGVLRALSDCNRFASMTASISMSVFHQWLLAEPTGNHPACAIILHIPDSQPCEFLIQDISDYLNEYDDEGDGRWLPATPELVEKISRDPSHRRLLGMSDGPVSRLCESELINTFAALGQRGHVVFRAPGVTGEGLNLTNTFHAGVGAAGEVLDECHLILNPKFMDQKCIAHVIGDVFLEWLHCEGHRNAAIHEFR